MPSKKVIITTAAMLAATAGVASAPAIQSAPAPSPDSQYGPAATSECKARNAAGCTSQNSCTGACIQEAATAGVERERARLDIASDCPCGPDQAALDRVYYNSGGTGAENG